MTPYPVKKVFLAPHNDDEVLFGAYHLIAEEPDVVVVLRSEGNYAQRELETAAAMKLLGRPWSQWAYSDRHPPWPQIRQDIQLLAEKYDLCFAPVPRFAANQHDPAKATPNGFGVLHHDRIGQMALDSFGERWRGYTTYFRGGLRDTDGIKVKPEPEWVLKKLQALACYRSQIMDPNTTPHFVGDLNEYHVLYEPPKP